MRRKIIRSLLVGLCTLMHPSSVVAAELPFEKFITQVLNQHPVLKASEQEIDGARAELLSAQGAFDPVLKGEYTGYSLGNYTGKYGNLFVEQPFEFAGARAFAGYRKGQDKFPIYEDYYNTNTGGEARAGIEFPLLRDGPIDRRRASIARAALFVDFGSLGLEQRKLELYRAGSVAYWEWVGAYKKWNAYKEMLTTAEERDRQLLKRVRAGDLAEIEKIDNERQVLQRQNQLNIAERSLQKAAFELGLFLWGENGEPSPEEARIPPAKLSVPLHVDLNIEDMQIRALKTRPEAKRIQNQIDQNAVELKLAQNQILPRLDLQTIVADDLGSGSPSRDETELKASVKLEIPLATRTQRGKIQLLEAKNRELKLQKSLVEQKISVEIADLLNALKQAISRTAIARDEVRVAEKLESAERRKFELGESNLIFINLREQTTLDARVREIDALADSWKSSANLQAATGEQPSRP